MIRLWNTNVLWDHSTAAQEKDLIKTYVRIPQQKLKPKPEEGQQHMWFIFGGGEGRREDHFAEIQYMKL